MRKNLFKFSSIILVILALTIYSCGGGTTKVETKEVVKEETKPTLDVSKGKLVYDGKCLVCHQASGMGVEGTFPPLAGSDYLLADKQRAIVQTIQGAASEITVNGKKYKGGVMGPTVAGYKLTDEEIADVVNYILNSWGNNAGTVTLDEVKAAKKTAGI